MVILAFAVLDPAVWEPSRTLDPRPARGPHGLCGVGGRGPRPIRDAGISQLRGWARRSPLLVVALVAIGVANVGWPGFLAFDSRATVITMALARPVQGLVLLAVFLPVLYYGRLLAIGFSHPTPEVAAVSDDRLRRRGDADGRRNAGRPRLEGMGRLLGLNRGPLVASLVIVLAASAITIASGGFGFVGVADAAREAAPVVSGGNDLPETGPVRLGRPEPWAR